MMSDAEIQEIHFLCEKYRIQNYYINDDGRIDVDGNVANLFNEGLEVLPLKFRTVTGIFRCDWNKLITLEGCPEYVGSYFRCDCNKLETLEGGPKVVGWNYNCDSNQLMSLKGAPKQLLNGSITCAHNYLLSLEGAPQLIKGEFDCRHNKLITLEGLSEGTTTVHTSFNPIQFTDKDAIIAMQRTRTNRIMEERLRKLEKI